jgi:hypothetical protein
MKYGKGNQQPATVIYSISFFLILHATNKIIVTGKRTSEAEGTTAAMTRRNRKIFMKNIHSKTGQKDAY